MSGPKSSQPTLISVVRDRMRRLGMAYRSEQVYVAWIRRFVRANGHRHPRDCGAEEIERFLTHRTVAGARLAVARLSVAFRLH